MEMGNTGSKMTLHAFLREDQKEPIAEVASRLAGEMTKVAIMTKDAGVKAAGEAARNGTEAAIGAIATAAAGTTAGAVAGALAGPVGMVVGAIATAILNGIWNAIFPPDSTEVHASIEEIRNVLRQELHEDTITKINGLLSDLRARLTIDYANSRKTSDLTDKRARQRLHDELEALNSNMDGVIGTLMQKSYAKIGLVNFLLLAGLRLALYQEMANVDPQNEDSQFNPTKSRYAAPEIGVVAEYARRYADHAEKYWKQVQVEYRKSINVTDWRYQGGRIDNNLSGGCGFQQDTNRSARALAEEYWEKQKRKLEEKFCHPEEIIANWRRLIEVPLNVPDIKGSTMTLDEFLRGNEKDPIADAASRLAEEMTKEAVTVAKDAAGAAASEAFEGADTAAVIAGPIGVIAGALATKLLSDDCEWEALIPLTKVDPAIADIQKALGQDLGDTTERINDLLSVLKAKLRNIDDYAHNMKDSDLTKPDDRRHLYGELKSLNNELDEGFVMLQQDKYAKIGLAIFLLLASLRLALYQEMANVDPRNRDQKFNAAKSLRYASPHTGQVAKHARQYAKHAETVWLQVLKDRKKTIKVTTYIGNKGGRVEDELTGDFQQDTNR
ncbi:uncharacterized protein LOC118405291 isoform X1 [Branchiostoma floridae]|uniref:Uncharacterized protein LOC118405291 isoform X1 n=2 Tax=Branchiostoma floridae TaxID=7739 RepID=A0A9J7HJ51_BRAFL|nr:uncharacterized protein LOC118405291 isoform X1 [Branchiostoma floridae]